MKIMHGWFSRANANISRITLADSPMYLSTIPEATTFKNFALTLQANALAKRVLPIIYYLKYK
jgi:hypothetical protein